MTFAFWPSGRARPRPDPAFLLQIRPSHKNVIAIPVSYATAIAYEKSHSLKQSLWR